MGYDEFLATALTRGKTYDQLPPALQSLVTFDEYQTKVKEHWISKGVEWKGSPAEQACGEAEYYDNLVKSYKAWMRVFPYHLAGYVCRVMRVSPYKYYIDVMATALVAERPYHQLPNFTAADAVRVLGIGRNEYIATLNACKGRRLLWRVNRTSVARELLPSEPLDIPTQPWWRVNCVNLSESEFRELGVDEMAVLKSAGMPGSQLCCRDVDRLLLMGLWRKGLVYFEVAVQPTDRFTIPPLEGFVSNKDAAQPLGARGTGAADPLEALMYAVFVANSERLTVQDLAGILNQSVSDVCTAMSVACRLGFSTRIDSSPAGRNVPVGRALSHTLSTLPDTFSTAQGRKREVPDLLISLEGDGDEGATPRAAEGSSAQMLADQLMSSRSDKKDQVQSFNPSSLACDGRAVAVVLDSEATSFLMMGALSPGLKRHAVTLFEGGRVAGDATMTELTTELWASYAEGQAFEGDMARLTQFAGALATVLDVVRAAAGAGVPVELLRKESLSGLQPAAAAKVLATAYCVLLAVTPLPHPPLPLALNQPNAPAYFGPTAHFMSPWAVLALYQAAGCGPTSLVLCAGQRLWQLPAPLQGATHALVWSWDMEQDATRAKASGLPGSVTDGGPSLVDASLLLFTLNELLTRSALLVQPLNASTATTVTEQPTAGEDETEGMHDEAALLGSIVDVPLPLPSSTLSAIVGITTESSYNNRSGLLLQASSVSAASVAKDFSSVQLRGVSRRTSDAVNVTIPASVVRAVHTMGLSNSVGILRLIQLPGQHGPFYSSALISTASIGPASAEPVAHLPGKWLPFSLHLGVPMYCLPLCKAVCAQAQSGDFMTTDGLEAQVKAQQKLQQSLDALTAQYAPASVTDANNTAEPSKGPVTRARLERLGSIRAGLPVPKEPITPASQGLSYGVVPLPGINMLFDGSTGHLQACDLSNCVQGPGVMHF